MSRSKPKKLKSPPKRRAGRAVLVWGDRLVVTMPNGATVSVSAVDYQALKRCIRPHHLREALLNTRFGIVEST